jgi:uracil-DNA glycosylase
MAIQIEDTWKLALQEEFAKPYFLEIVNFLKQEKAKGTIIYPAGGAILNAFAYTPFNEVKVVILGQDPYHNPQQAHGLCFSVNDGIAPPPSLVNIFKEIHSDLGLEIPKTGNLSHWARQGVLLLNSSLTVEAHKPMSHSQIGWHLFTDAVIKKISEEKENIVFVLWGKFAQSKATLINAEKHLILKAAHPSPLSAYNGFFGCKHFSKTNEWLSRKQLSSIDWKLSSD